jgi:hypothetical protein
MALRMVTFEQVVLSAASAMLRRLSSIGKISALDTTAKRIEPSSSIEPTMTAFAGSPEPG